MTQARYSGRSGGFTLVELLVVIGIVALLIAILLPMITRVRRGAIALASPIVVRTGDRGLLLEHPTGKSELELVPLNEVCNHGWPNGPAWSTNGRYVGYSIHVSSTVHLAAIINPASGVVYRHLLNPTVLGTFTGWADDETFIELTNPSSTPTFDLRDATTGAVRRRYRHPGWQLIPKMQISPAPPNTGAYYVTGYVSPAGSHIVLLRKDFSPCKTIWFRLHTPGPGGQSYNSEMAPRIDPLGEYAAWNHHLSGAGEYPAIAVKPLRQHPSEPPSVVGRQFGVPVFFCDWTEGGDLLAIIPGLRASRLVVLDRDGNLLRDIPTSGTPYFHVGSAHWRKYGHR